MARLEPGAESQKHGSRCCGRHCPSWARAEGVLHMKLRNQRGVVFRSAMMASLVMAATGACGSGATPQSTASPEPMKKPPSRATDTTVVVRRGGLEVSIRLDSIPRKVGEWATLYTSVRNVGNAAQQIEVPPCRVRARGVQVAAGLECATSSIRFTLQAGRTWSTVNQLRFDGPPGRHLFEVNAVIDPEAWVGLDLELAAE
jgi:hypothetical protein